MEFEYYAQVADLERKRRNAKTLEEWIKINNKIKRITGRFVYD